MAVADAPPIRTYIYGSTADLPTTALLQDYSPSVNLSSRLDQSYLTIIINVQLESALRHGRLDRPRLYRHCPAS